MRSRASDRLYRLLPGHIQARDAGEGEPLKALMQLLTTELETVESDADALYDNWFIETCEDWVVPYIGDLVGARQLRPFGGDGGSLRAYVANTIAYRQAKGTIAIIEQLARDVSGWPCVGVEFFRRLIQTQNVNHVRPDNFGTVSLADADAASLTGGPFEIANHHVDVRSVEKGIGRYNIPNIGLIVWRLQSYMLPFGYDDAAGYLGGVEPKPSALGPGFRFIDPVGRPLRLFNPPRTEASIATAGSEPTMPGPLRRRPVARDLDDLRAGRPGAGRYVLGRTLFAARLDGAPLSLAQLHCCNLEDRPDGLGGTTWRRPAQAGDLHFDPELGRIALHAADQGKTVELAYAYGAPHDIGGGPYDRRASIEEWIDPFLDNSAGGTLWQIGVTRRTELVTNTIDHGGPVVGTLAAAIAAWNAQAVPGARGIIAVMDSGSYREALTTIQIPSGARLAIVAAGWPAEAKAGALFRTPGRLAPQDRRPHIAGDINVQGMGQANAAPGMLLIDGLLVEGGMNVAAGDLGEVQIRHSTVGASATRLAASVAVKSIPAGPNARLSIAVTSSIVGAIDATGAAGGVTIRDSIVGEDRVAGGGPAPSQIAVTAPDADLVVQRTTLFGQVKGRTLEADDSIFAEPLTIARRQQGCVRFSYIPEGSRTPRRYRCAPYLQIAAAKEAAGGTLSPQAAQAIRERLRPMFVSTLAEHQGFGQLAQRCPAEIAAGAEGGLEMGALNGLGNPARLANIIDALDEYLPVGLAAGIIVVT